MGTAYLESHSMACPHARQRWRGDEGRCRDCDAVLPVPPPRQWHGRAPLVVGDLKPHFNTSAGRPITSRADLSEYCKREGVRPITPDLATEKGAWDAADEDRKRVSEAIRKPKVSLGEVYYEDTVAAPVGEDIR